MACLWGIIIITYGEARGLVSAYLLSFVTGPRRARTSLEPWSIGGCEFHSAVCLRPDSFASSLFLGLVEAVVTPGMTILTSIWYAQNEVPFRTLIWCSFNGWAGIIGGFLAYGVSHRLAVHTDC